jgi:hypothetical protein
LKTLFNSPDLKTLFRNILNEIPETTDLSEITPETAATLEKTLSALQQVRTEESGLAAIQLEHLIDQIHEISGEYRS